MSSDGLDGRRQLNSSLRGTATFRFARVLELDRRKGEHAEAAERRYRQGGYLFAQITDDVAARRKEAGLSQQRLADRCETTQSAIARLESGGRPPRIDTLLRLADALDCDLAVELRPRSSR